MIKIVFKLILSVKLLTSIVEYLTKIYSGQLLLDEKVFLYK